MLHTSPICLVLTSTKCQRLPISFLVTSYTSSQVNFDMVLEIIFLTSFSKFGIQGVKVDLILLKADLAIDISLIISGSFYLSVLNNYPNMG